MTVIPILNENIDSEPVVVQLWFLLLLVKHIYISDKVCMHSLDPNYQRGTELM